MQTFVVELANLEHAFHELRKVLELRPLIVNSAQRRVHVDRFFNMLHRNLLSLRSVLRPRVSTQAGRGWPGKDVAVLPEISIQ